MIEEANPLVKAIVELIEIAATLPQTEAAREFRSFSLKQQGGETSAHGSVGMRRSNSSSSRRRRISSTRPKRKRCVLKSRNF